jgi:hypothetical protein
MAKKVEVQLVDDLDGSEAVESITFGLDGKTYEIDLNRDHATALRENLAEYIASGRRLGGDVRRRQVASAPRVGRHREELARIREWARANGHQVKERGRIPAAVIEAYQRAA